MRVGLMLSVSCLLSLSSVAYASGSLKVSTIKEMYESSVLYDAESHEYYSDPEILYNYINDSLARALLIQDNFILNEGAICAEPLGSVMWGGSNDPDFNTNLSYSMYRDGRVQVKFGYGGSTLYSLQCNNESCQITDMYAGTSATSSFKSAINKGCR